MYHIVPSFDSLLYFSALGLPRCREVGFIQRLYIISTAVRSGLSDGLLLPRYVSIWGSWGGCTHGLWLVYGMVHCGVSEKITIIPLFLVTASSWLFYVIYLMLELCVMIKSKLYILTIIFWYIYFWAWILYCWLGYKFGFCEMNFKTGNFSKEWMWGLERKNFWKQNIFFPYKLCHSLRFPYLTFYYF